MYTRIYIYIYIYIYYDMLILSILELKICPYHAFGRHCTSSVSYVFYYSVPHERIQAIISVESSTLHALEHRK